MNVKELAKELSMNSRELLEKINKIGIKAKTIEDDLTDDDISAVKSKLSKKKSTETKVVKRSPKKETKKEESGEPKVKVKAANIKLPSEVEKPAPPKAKAAKPSSSAAHKPPAGTPVVSKTVESRKKTVKPPVGTPVVPKDLHSEEEKKPAEKKAAAPATEKAAEEKKPAAETKPEKKAEPKAAEKPAEKTSDEKKLAAEKPAEKKPAAKKKEEPIGPIIVRTAAEEKDRIAKQKAEQEAKRKAAKKKAEKQQEKKTAEKPRRQRPAASGSAADVPSEKTDGRKDRKKKKDKEHDKFDKLEKQKNRRMQEQRSLEKKAKPKKKQKPKPAPEPEVEAEPLPVGTKVINVPITVAGLSEQLQISTSKIIMTLMKLGIMANINQNLDEDTVVVLAEELGVNVVIGKVEEEEKEEGIEVFEDKEEDMEPRPPIITVMGHVDHGKTSLLDAIRNTNVTAGESGGITQHIGASEVEINGQKIVFLDTPGHEAFTAMRARGAHITDIAVLVVAADDSVKPQTIESISHAKAAGVPIIVAINKMDKPGANPDMVKKDLADNGVLVEDWGGDVISVPVSAKTGDGITNLLEMILLQAEVLELKANPNRLATGTVIEARLDKAKGPVATLLVTNGTLKSTMSVVAGTSAGRIRLMTNYRGDTIHKAGPATAVEILGLSEVPAPGDSFNAVKNDKTAKEIAEHRKLKQREEVMARTSSSTLEELFSRIQEGEVKELNLIVKGDVQGSVGAVSSSLEKLSTDEVKVKIVHTGVGAITESDVMLAGTSDAVIIGFNVRPAAGVAQMADRDNVQIRTYRVIYDILDDVENAMKGMLDPEFKEVVLGEAEIRDTFKVPGVGIIGGAYVTSGKVARNAEVRLVRDGIVIHEGKISSLKRFKDDAKEVAQGYECGIGIEDYNDIKEGDVIECFHMEEIERE